MNEPLRNAAPPNAAPKAKKPRMDFGRFEGY